MKNLNEQALNLKESVFSTITQLANTHGAINLAQGFPDFDADDWVLKIGQRVLLENKNQYAPSYGVLSLRTAISNLYQKFYDLNYDPQTEILVTNGATEAIYASITALINPGDEVIAFEPLYDSYAASVELAKGVLKPVTLHSPDFTFDKKELLSQINSKTKLLILNNPHNPTGKVFTQEEILEISQLAIKHDFYILSDEVYEYLTFDCTHHPLACNKEIKDRVLTISSVGKTLSLTGWKVGWVCGPKELIKTIHNVHQYICFCVSHPFQVILSEVLNDWPQHVEKFRTDYKRKKELLTNGLKQLGAEVISPKGTYFAVVKTPPQVNDWQFSQDLITKFKVATIPLSPFYLKSREGESMVRFCFAKKDETLKQALNNLKGAPFQ
jgi:aspartate/methionine/tyrosine aminotransferase